MTAVRTSPRSRSWSSVSPVTIDKHLPFLRESSKSNHHLKLRRDGDISSAHVPKGSKELVEVQSGVVVDAYVCTKAILEVPKDCRCHRFAICLVETIPHCIGSGALDQRLLNRCIGPQNNVAYDHAIFL